MQSIKITPMLNYRKCSLNKYILAIAIFTVCFSGTTLLCQDTSYSILSIQRAVDLALKNSLELNNADLRIRQAEYDKKLAIDIRPTEFSYKNGQMYGIENSQYFEVNQNFGSILKQVETVKKAKMHQELSVLERNLKKQQIIAEVKSAYVLWEYAYQISLINNEEKKIYQQLADIAELKYKTGDISLMKKALLKTKFSEVINRYLMSTDELAIAENKLNYYMDTSGYFIPPEDTPEMYLIDRPAGINNYYGNTLMDYQNTLYLEAEQEIDLRRSEYFPELEAGVFRQEIGSTGQLNGWQIGINVPLWIPKQNAQIQQARIEAAIAQNNLEQKNQEIAYQREYLMYQLNKYFRQITHFQDNALPEAEIILNTASLQLKNEEIEYTEFLDSVSEAYNIRRQFCQAILNYNQTAIELEIYAK
jgi:heavy metal efflux system protein